MITLTINAASFAELSGLLASMQSAPLTVHTGTLAVLDKHNASVDDKLAATKTKAEADSKIAAEKRAAAEAELKAEAATKAKPSVEQQVKAEDAKAEVVYADVQQAVYALHAKHGRDKVVATLADIGVAKAQDLDPSTWADALAKLNAAIDA